MPPAFTLKHKSVYYGVGHVSRNGKDISGVTRWVKTVKTERVTEKSATLYFYVQA